MKLARELSRRSTGRTLYILDEPTTGLHFEDTRKLLDVLNKLVEQGNTVVVIEHNLDVIRCADYLIDLGPEGGAAGGRLIAAGTPEEVAANPKSVTGQFLRLRLIRPEKRSQPDHGAPESRVQRSDSRGKIATLSLVRFVARLTQPRRNRACCREEVSGCNYNLHNDLGFERH